MKNLNASNDLVRTIAEDKLFMMACSIWAGRKNSLALTHLQESIRNKPEYVEDVEAMLIDARQDVEAGRMSKYDLEGQDTAQDLNRGLIIIRNLSNSA